MKAYCFKLYNAKRNRKLMTAINIAGIIYNHCIALHKRYYKLFGKSLDTYALQKHITKLKKLKKYGFWNRVGSQSIQDITQRIDRAYKLFFRNRKQNIRSAPPSFKKVRKYKSFTLKQAGYKLLADNRIIILGQEYKFHKSRDIEGTVKTLTVKRDTLGDIYIYLVCKQESNQVVTRTGKSIGFDFGLKKFLVSSDGSDIEAPMSFKQNADVIKTANRRLEIPHFYPSSKTCSCCAYVLDELPLSARVWVCPACDVEHDRDRNAANNILKVGASTLQGEVV